MMELRPYQQTARLEVEREWASGNNRTLLVLPTGTGKTVVFASVSQDVTRSGGRVLVLAHRGELLDQAADKIEAVSGLKCAREQAEDTSVGTWYSITVGSVQTMMRENRLNQFTADHYDAIIIDEAHHVLAESYQRVLSHFPAAKILGVTATPDRGDLRNLGEYFDSLAYEYSLPQAIKDGYLCPIKAQTVPLRLDISQVSMQNGDFKAADLGDALDPYLDRIADEMIAAGCKDRRTVVFLPLVRTSKKFRSILEEKGLSAAEVDGESTDRAEILADFDAGRYDVLCNSMLLTEGWDCPPVDCIIVLRPTKIRSLYAQMVGRGTRLSPETGKDHLLILDFLWHTERHELVHPAHLIAASDDVAKAMTKRIDEAGYPLTLEEVEEQAQSDVVKAREEALAKQLHSLRARKRKLVDPLQFEMSIQAEDISSYVPAFAWEAKPASEKQREALEDAGISAEDICTGKASLMLDKLSKRREAGLATPKQIRQLEGRGFQHVGTWDFADATKMIARIASNGWITPPQVDPVSYEPRPKAMSV